MKKHGLSAVISNRGFIPFNHATLVIKSEKDWYISVANDEDNDYNGQLELILETEEGKSYLTRGDYHNHRIDGIDKLSPLRVG
jgi:hypothetical protein